MGSDITTNNTPQNTGPYDLSKLTPDKTRLARRKKLLKQTMVASIVIFIGGFLLTMPNAITGKALKSYFKNDFNGAARTLRILTFPNMIESYKLHLNTGDSHYQLGKFKEAESQFRAAQELAPSKYYCQMTINLALSIEAQADALASEKKYDEAIVRYDEVKTLATDGKCGGSKPENQAKQKLQQAEQRAQSKSDQAKQARNGDKAEDQQKDTGEQNQPDPAQEQKLKNAAAESAKIRAKRQQQRQSSQDNSEHKYDAKNW
jgi:hypothetical protein